MDDNKEKDEVEEIFNRALEIQDEKKAIEEEEEIDEAPDTHHVELVAPTIAVILAILSIIFDVVWFAAYFGILFSLVGIYICNTNKGYIRKGIILYNVIAFALSFLVGAVWIVLYLFR